MNAKDTLIKTAAKNWSKKDKNVPVSPEIDIEARFNEAVEGMKLICKAQIKNVDRIDSLVGTYQDLINWDLAADIASVQAAVDEEKKNYETALDIIEGLKLGDFKKKEMQDPIAPFIPNRYGITNKQEMYDAFVVFKCLRPYGEKIEQLHSIVIEAMENNGETIG